jgi:YidC/Oxa1 family membrane protein insertase
MGFLSSLFNTVLYRPLFNLLILLYKYLPGNDFGIAIIALTVLIKVLLYPLGTRAIRSQKVLSELQPKIKEIQEKYKDNKEKQVKIMMELYKEEKINPLSGFLPILIQLPILLALYRVFWKGLRPEELSSVLYGSIFHIDAINSSFLGLIDLSQAVRGADHKLIIPNLILIIIVGILQYIQMKMVAPKTQKAKVKSGGTSQFSDMMQKQMTYFFPIFTIFILWKLPAALALYWLVTTLFSIIQQYFVFKKKSVQAVSP